MNAFAKTVTNFGTESDSFTLNGAPTLPSSGKSIVDLFFAIGSSRKKDITPAFVAAINEDTDLAIRVLLWARDIRGGSGERQTFRNLLGYLEKNNFDLFERVLAKIPELGRFDDLLVATTDDGKKAAYTIIAKALEDGNGLCAKWMPRKGPIAIELRDFLGLTPRKYRKTLVNLTRVVETQMCNKEWSEVNYSHVPSVAAARYRKAFYKHDQERYAAYVEALKQPNKPKNVKINAAAIYPHDIIATLLNRSYGNKTERDVAVAQWDALPDYINDKESFLPIVDVSGSMSGLPMNVAVALGLYTSQRNKSAFKDIFMTFSSKPKLQKLTGDIANRCNQLVRAEWEMSTNVEAAFKLVLDHARKNNVPQEDMPSMFLIMSDMEFNTCTRNPSKRAFEDLQEQYEAAGYRMPKVVFWNLNARLGNVPVSHTEQGTALVSGFSPAIMTSLLGGGSFDPLSIVRKAVCKERYDY